MKSYRRWTLGMLLGTLLISGAQAGEKEAATACCTEGLEPIAAADWDYAKARHLLWRAGFGGTPREIEKLHAMGLESAVDYLVNYGAIPAMKTGVEIVPRKPDIADFLKKKGVDPRFAKRRKNLSEKENKQYYELRREFSRLRNKKERERYNDVRELWMKRMAESPRPLEEKMVLFWHGLLVSSYTPFKMSYALYNQNELYRRHAAGNYGELMHGLVRDAMMLRYLDNNSNVKGKPNENLAREIMELFTMGEGQGYGEHDIVEAARALTGNTYDRKSGEFVFREKSHDDGEKTIFGVKGNFDGDDLVDLILAQSATARYVTGKIFAFFAYVDPDEAIVDALATRLRKGNYEVAPVLKTIFSSKAFYSDKAMGTQVKSPAQLVVGVVRSLGIENADYAAMLREADGMEQAIFNPPNVKGWEGGDSWVNTNTIFKRQNFSGWIATSKVIHEGEGKGGYRGIGIVERLKGEKLDTSEAVVDYLA
ncbi:MAG: DUF1800 family protein, partial [Verrucomicrobiales bacterium]